MNKVYSIVVLFNPDNSILNNVDVINMQSDHTFVVVNSCNSKLLLELQKLNVELIINETNVGLAKALNIGIKKCLENASSEFIALFDQDSTPTVGMLDSLKDALNKDKLIAAAGPRIVDIKKTKSTLESERVIPTDVIISSGCLISVKNLKEVGLMDETFFIDYIDYEWCLRAKSKGYKIVQVQNANLFHNMGDTFVNIFGITKPIHKNKIRHYYIIRNQLIMLNRDYLSFKWKIVHSIKLIYRIPAFIILSDESFITFKMIIKAIKDFVLFHKDFKEIKF